MAHHVPDTDNVEQHKRLLAWREWIFGVTDGAEHAVRSFAANDLDDE